MAVLNSMKILQEKNTSDPSSITSLTLTHKALSDVSCLSEFKNLERLDLSFNNLTSLEGLKSCVNLKWLSVVQNKLQSLKGIEGLTKLTVLNAGKNKLKSMDEVKSLLSLRALILNENEITSVCKLDQVKELNTLVLSRNPISSLGDSLIKVKSITKLSLSNCQLQSIDASLMFCTELKELRLAHNEIDTIPSEFERLVKLQNLDMGNNLIIHRSSLKVLASMVNLRNLNLKGNPVAEKDNILKKVKKLLPNLNIFNAKPIDKISAKEVPEKDEDFKDNHFIDDEDLRTEKKRKKARDGRSVGISENANVSEKKMNKKVKLQQNEGEVTGDAETLNVNPAGEKKSKHKKSQKKIKGESGDKAIDSAEIPFTDLFATAPDIADKELHHKTNRNLDAVTGLVTHPKKKKKNRAAVNPAALESSRIDEIGLGGPSAWDEV